MSRLSGSRRTPEAEFRFRMSLIMKADLFNEPVEELPVQEPDYEDGDNPTVQTMTGRGVLSSPSSPAVAQPSNIPPANRSSTKTAVQAGSKKRKSDNNAKDCNFNLTQDASVAKKRKDNPPNLEDSATISQAFKNLQAENANLQVRADKATDLERELEALRVEHDISTILLENAGMVERQRSTELHLQERNCEMLEDRKHSLEIELRVLRDINNSRKGERNDLDEEIKLMRATRKCYEDMKDEYQEGRDMWLKVRYGELTRLQELEQNRTTALRNENSELKKQVETLELEVEKTLKSFDDYKRRVRKLGNEL